MAMLQVGSRGSAVVALQKKLGISADGIYGPQTRAAVVKYQRANGLAADGIAGPLTMGKMAARPAVVVPRPVAAPVRAAVPVRSAAPVFSGAPVIDPMTEYLKTQDERMAADKESQQRDAGVIVSNLFKQYGLESLAPKIAEYLKAGYNADAVSLMLQDTNEYKTRFAGNAARIKAGLSVLSPGEYLATEKSYGQVMRKYGLPAGFHDSPTDFQKFIENDVSAVELDKRASDAQSFVNQNDAQNLAYFRQFYSDGDMIAFALDPDRAAPLVGKAFEASRIGGAAATQGININQGVAEDLQGRGITGDQASQGFGMVATDQQSAKDLSAIYGGQALTTNDLINATFKSDADATQRKAKLASQERATFGASGGAASNALSSSSYGGV